MKGTDIITQGFLLLATEARTTGRGTDLEPSFTDTGLFVDLTEKMNSGLEDRDCYPINSLEEGDE